MNIYSRTILIPLLAILTTNQSFGQASLSSLGIYFCTDTTLQIPLSKALTVKADLKITQPKLIGTIYSLSYHSAEGLGVNGSITDTVTSWWGPPKFELVDVTFDGYLDLRLRIDFGHAELYHTYIYNPRRGGFEFCGSCDDLFGFSENDVLLDTLHQKIKATNYWWNADGPGVSTRVFSIVNGFPVEEIQNPKRQ